MLNKKIHILVILFVSVLTGFSVVFTGTVGAFAGRASAVPAPTPGVPPYAGYKGVTIGTPAGEARTKLGVPKEKSDEQDFYIFSETESAQVYYDAAKTVSAIMVTYNGKLDSAPTAKAIFGEDAAAKPDGGIFKMERYPKAGFWISYNKTSGDEPIVIVAIQKM